jgi:hypothetical protein
LCLGVFHVHFSFTVQPRTIKKRLEELITRELVRRSVDQPGSFEFVA